MSLGLWTICSPCCKKPFNVYTTSIFDANSGNLVGYLDLDCNVQDIDYDGELVVGSGLAHQGYCIPYTSTKFVTDISGQGDFRYLYSDKELSTDMTIDRVASIMEMIPIGNPNKKVEEGLFKISGTIGSISVPPGLQIQQLEPRSTVSCNNFHIPYGELDCYCVSQDIVLFNRYKLTGDFDQDIKDNKETDVGYVQINYLDTTIRSNGFLIINLGSTLSLRLIITGPDHDIDEYVSINASDTKQQAIDKLNALDPTITFDTDGFRTGLFSTGNELEVTVSCESQIVIYPIPTTGKVLRGNRNVDEIDFNGDEQNSLNANDKLNLWFYGVKYSAIVKTNTMAKDIKYNFGPLATSIQDAYYYNGKLFIEWKKYPLDFDLSIGNQRPNILIPGDLGWQYGRYQRSKAVKANDFSLIQIQSFTQGQVKFIFGFSYVYETAWLDHPFNLEEEYIKKLDFDTYSFLKYISSIDYLIKPIVQHSQKLEVARIENHNIVASQPLNTLTTGIYVRPTVPSFEDRGHYESWPANQYYIIYKHPNGGIYASGRRVIENMPGTEPYGGSEWHLTNYMGHNIFHLFQLDEDLNIINAKTAKTTFYDGINGWGFADYGNPAAWSPLPYWSRIAAIGGNILFGNLLYDSSLNYIKTTPLPQISVIQERNGLIYSFDIGEIRVYDSNFTLVRSKFIQTNIKSFNHPGYYTPHPQYLPYNVIRFGIPDIMIPFAIPVTKIAMDDTGIYLPQDNMMTKLNYDLEIIYQTRDPYDVNPMPTPRDSHCQYFWTHKIGGYIYATGPRHYRKSRLHHISMYLGDFLEFSETVT